MASSIAQPIEPVESLRCTDENIPAAFKGIIADIREKLAYCLEHHPCGKAFPTKPPARLLDIGDASKARIKLIDANSHVGRYVALSYCWGTSTPFITTPATLDQRHQGFEAEAMPKTLRDAVTITRALGVRYLWIDALCILQGKSKKARKDWKRESAIMDSVYGNAVITIMAASSPHCDSGIFDSCGDGGAKHRRSFIFEPLNTRAWALQELHLSARLAVFAASKTFFLCLEPQKLEERESPPWRLVPPRGAEPDPHSWLKILADYTCRELTDSGDKLPAIAGLARLLDDLTGRHRMGRYLAGLWEADLPGCLLWKSSSEYFKGFNLRRVTGRAPSWSWASVDGSVLPADNVGLFSWRYDRESRCGAGFRAEVLAADTTLASPDPYSKVSSGRIVIRGPAKLGIQKQLLSPGNCDFWWHDGDGNDRRTLEFSVDDPSDLKTTRLKPHKSALACLLVDTAVAGYRGLLLQRQMRLGPTVYQRIGVVFSQSKEGERWWDDAKTMTLTIV